MYQRILISKYTSVYTLYIPHKNAMLKNYQNVETSEINQNFYEGFLFRQSKFHISLNVFGQWVELSYTTETFRKLFFVHYLWLYLLSLVLYYLLTLLIYIDDKYILRIWGRKYNKLLYSPLLGRQTTLDTQKHTLFIKKNINYLWLIDRIPILLVLQIH